MEEVGGEYLKSDKEEKIKLTTFVRGCNLELKRLYELMSDLKRGVKSDANIRSEESCKEAIKRLKEVLKHVYQERYNHGFHGGLTPE